MAVLLAIGSFPIDQKIHTPSRILTLTSTPVSAQTGDLVAAQKLRDELSFRVAAYEQTGIVMDEEYGAEDEDFLGGGDDQA